MDQKCTLWFKKNATNFAEYNYDPDQSILTMFGKLFANDHNSCLVVKFSTSPHTCCQHTLWNTTLYFATITLLIAKNTFSSGGSEKNRLITGADVRTGDLLPSRMRVAVLSTGQRLRRRHTAGCWPMCQRGASSSRLCHGPASCTDAAASGPKCGNRLLQ